MTSHENLYSDPETLRQAAARAKADVTQAQSGSDRIDASEDRFRDLRSEIIREIGRTRWRRRKSLAISWCRLQTVGPVRWRARLFLWCELLFAYFVNLLVWLFNVLVFIAVIALIIAAVLFLLRLAWALLVMGFQWLF